MLCREFQFRKHKLVYVDYDTQRRKQGRAFIETTRNRYLYHHLLEPTRSWSTDNPSLIDSVLTNEVMQVSHIEFHAPLGKTDHCVITFKYHWITPNWKKDMSAIKTDFNSMRRQLALSNWTEKFMTQNQSRSVEELWNSFKSEIGEILDKFVPKQLSGIPSWKTKGSVTINQVLRSPIWNKSKLHRR